MEQWNNPYQPGAGSRPPALVGRDSLEKEAEVALKRALNGLTSKALGIVGLRGVGKTVLLARFVGMAEQLEIPSVLIEAPEDGQFLRTLGRELRQVLVNLQRRGKISKAVHHALGVFKSFSMTVGLDGTFTVGFDVKPERGKADSGNPDLDVRDLIVAIGEAAKDRKTAVLITVDELQYLERKELGALIGALHRTTQLGLPIVFAGAGLPNVPALVGKAKTYAERLFDFHPIGPLTANDVRLAIVRPAQEREVTFDDPAVQSIVELTEGYPYFVQEWAYDAWNVAKQSPITLEDVRRASGTVYDRLDRSFFSIRFDRLTMKEKEYLRAMASLGSDTHGSGAIAIAAGTNSKSIARIRDSLIRKGMIYSPSHGQTAFTVPLFDRFLKRTA